MVNLFHYLLIVLPLVAVSLNGSAQNLIAVQNGSGVTYYPHDSLQQAIDEATEGSVIHLPGGTFTRTGGFTLSNSVSLIGVGYGSDSTVATGQSVIGSTLNLTENSSNSYLAGLRFSTYVQPASGTNPVLRNMFFHRCSFSQRWGVGSGAGISSNSNNISFLECALDEVLFNGATNCSIVNCIIDGNIYSGSSLTVESCVITSGSISPNSVCKNCNFRGNIFTTTATLYTVAGNPNFLVNNVLVGSLTGSSTLIEYGNIYNVQLGSVFVNYTAPYDPTDDFHLAPGSPAIGAGPGGTDCGIYGGVSPWKDGGLPANPHVMEKVIGATTNAQGELPVTIRVAAQGN